jgi:DNA mismatch repair protein MutL
MGRIRILSDAVANQIAAGEVVERPAAVVKELLENSLDAGATDLRIDIESGGRRLIRITDNGTGMLRDDALLAFERHATSKLSDVKDLEAIATLGFRGEALPSIASVSRLTLETRSADETTGTTIEIAGGKLLRCEESALVKGAVITVRDLFFNVPARKKFLRSEQTEIAHIAQLVTHYSLAHPDKSFQLTHGATELLDVTPVAQLRDRVYQVFGSNILDELMELEYQEREISIVASADDPDPVVRVFALRGFVSRPQVQKMNRNSIFLFVNGRLIRDRVVLHALSAAYHNLMPPACYPFALLFLDCDCEEVDVNVHPSKTEVRFRHSSVVHDFIRDSIRESLIASRPASSIPLPVQPQPAARLSYSEFSQQIEDYRAREQVAVAQGESAGELPELRLRAQAGPEPRFDFTGGEAVQVQQASATVRFRIPDSHGSFPMESYSDTPPSMHSLRDLRPLGQIHDSFIIAASRDGLWIIDQHVAHERILFEKVLKQRASGKIERQQLLMPLLIELTAGQQLQYARIADELNASGFESEPFGNRTIAVKAAPAAVGPGDIEKLIAEVLEIGEGEMRSLSLDDLRRGIAATIACRAAIKINMKLDQTKMDWLLAALAATDYPMSCPHGRPIALRYSTRDILKGFHRIS